MFDIFFNHQIKSKPLLNSNMGLIYFFFYFRPSSTAISKMRTYVAIMFTQNILNLFFCGIILWLEEKTSYYYHSSTFDHKKLSLGNVVI